MQLTEYLYLSTYPKFALFEKTKTKKKKHDFTFFYMTLNLIGSFHKKVYSCEGYHVTMDIEEDIR